MSTSTHIIQPHTTKNPITTIKILTKPVNKFPLYDKLLSIGPLTYTPYTKSSNSDVNDDTVRIISTTINKLPVANMETILGLVFHHWILANNSNESGLLSKMNSKRKINLIYGGNICSGGKGVIFDLNVLDEKLKIIICNYVLNITSQ